MLFVTAHAIIPRYILRAMLFAIVFFVFEQTFFGPWIVRNCRQNATEKEIKQGCPTFDEFVRFVSEAKKYPPELLIRNDLPSDCIPAPNSANHWRPISKLCHPCLIE